MLASRSSFHTLRMTKTSYRHPLQIPISGLCIISVHRYVCSIVLHFHVWQSMNKIKFKIPCMCLMCGQSPVLNNRLYVANKYRNKQLGDLSENCDIIMMMYRSSYTAYVPMLAVKLHLELSWLGNDLFSVK